MTCLIASADQMKFYLFAYDTHMLYASKNLILEKSLITWNHGQF